METCSTQMDEKEKHYGEGKAFSRSRHQQHPVQDATEVQRLRKDWSSTNLADTIAVLNPRIRGWANYHQYAASKRTFVKVDHAIFEALRRCAKRRHPNKGRRWIKRKYFLSEGTRNWVFYGEQEGHGGKTYRVRLLSASATRIKRRAKIKGAANPYDPKWEIYFEERLGVKMVDDLKGRRQLLRLWKEQDGICPVCN